MEQLTEKQNDVLKYLKERAEEGRSPSFREIMKEFGYKSIKAVQDHLKALESKGYIRRIKNMARSIEIPDFRKMDTVELPILGRIAAGTPILAEENIEGTIAIDRSWVKSENSFVLRVQGHSMIEAGIHDGDYAVIKQDYTAENNDIVAVMLENEVTLKRIFRMNNAIVLKPENSSMQPIIVKNKESKIRVIGKLTGIYRQVI